MRFLLLAAFTVAAVVGQDFSSVRVEKLATGFSGSEGPVWSRQGFLLFSDTGKKRIHKYTPGKGVEVLREVPSGPNGNTFDREGRLYTCEYLGRRVLRTDPTGQIEVFVDQIEGKRFNAPNDIVIRRDGNVYFTDPLFTPLDKRDIDFYGVYRVTPQQKVEVIAKPKSRPNGIALSPDGKILYVANTDEKNIRAYDLDQAGKASNERVLIDHLEGPPDGIKTDERGNLYLTVEGIVVYSPQGKRLGKIDTPERPLNCAFGDGDFRTLYITGETTLFRARVPVAGSIQY